MTRTFKIVQINNKTVNKGRYTTNSSPSSVAKKVFSKLYTKMKNKLTTFMIKETTQGSKKKVYGPYKGKRIKLKKPRMVKFKGTNKPVPIRYETKLYKVKTKKNTQKGGEDGDLETETEDEKLSDVESLDEDEVINSAQTYKNSLSNHWQYLTRELAKMPGYENVVIGFNLLQYLFRSVEDESSLKQAKSTLDQHFADYITEKKLGELFIEFIKLCKEIVVLKDDIISLEQNQYNSRKALRNRQLNNNKRRSFQTPGGTYSWELQRSYLEKFDIDFEKELSNSKSTLDTLSDLFDLTYEECKTEIESDNRLDATEQLSLLESLYQKVKKYIDNDNKDNDLNGSLNYILDNNRASGKNINKEEKKEQARQALNKEEKKEQARQAMIEADANDLNMIIGNHTIGAAINGRYHDLEVLLETHDINAIDDMGRTVLMFAAGYGRNPTLEMLIDKNADLDLQTGRGWTALHWAAGEGHEEACSILIDAGASINIKDKYGKTPLDVAIDEGKNNVITVFNAAASKKASATKIQSVIRGKRNRGMIKEYKEEEEKRIASKRRRARFLENNTKKSSKIPTAPPWARNQKLERERLELPKNIEKQRTTVKNSKYQINKNLAPRAEDPGKPNEPGNVGMADEFVALSTKERRAYLSKRNSTTSDNKMELLKNLYEKLNMGAVEVTNPFRLNGEIMTAVKQLEKVQLDRFLKKHDGSVRPA